MKSKPGSNGHEHVTETPDVSHIRNLDVSHELSDVNTRGIIKFIGGLTVLTVFVYILMWGMFRLLADQENKKDAERSPMAMTAGESLPPEPRLQGAPGFAAQLEKEADLNEGEKSAGPTPKDPLWEIRVLRQHWEAGLKNGAKDESGKQIGLPIQDAKKELLRQGLPVRANGAEAESRGLPTAWSSGRMAGGAGQ